MARTSKLQYQRLDGTGEMVCRKRVGSKMVSFTPKNVPEMLAICDSSILDYENELGLLSSTLSAVSYLSSKADSQHPHAERAIERMKGMCHRIQLNIFNFRKETVGEADLDKAVHYTTFLNKISSIYEESKECYQIGEILGNLGSIFDGRQAYVVYSAFKKIESFKAEDSVPDRRLPLDERYFSYMERAIHDIKVLNDQQFRRDNASEGEELSKIRNVEINNRIIKIFSRSTDVIDDGSGQGSGQEQGPYAAFTTTLGVLDFIFNLNNQMSNENAERNIYLFKAHMIGQKSRLERFVGSLNGFICNVTDAYKSGMFAEVCKGSKPVAKNTILTEYDLEIANFIDSCFSVANFFQSMLDFEKDHGKDDVDTIDDISLNKVDAFLESCGSENINKQRIYPVLNRVKNAFYETSASYDKGSDVMKSERAILDLSKRIYHTKYNKSFYRKQDLVKSSRERYTVLHKTLEHRFTEDSIENPKTLSNGYAGYSLNGTSLSRESGAKRVVSASDINRLVDQYPEDGRGRTAAARKACRKYIPSKRPSTTPGARR